jgi:hypothetical protein
MTPLYGWRFTAEGEKLKDHEEGWEFLAEKLLTWYSCVRNT